MVTIEESRAYKAPAAVYRDVQDLIEVYTQEGKDACLRRFKEIVEARQLKVFETVVLSGRFRQALTNNGIIWR
jgi:hypothetical protein